ncbi:MAG: HPr family phosphocarrier protein [Oscillospiraceae bacterium]|nr:HPr family phosphocarrier protein [Oscillospiraceae bacterium]
MRTFTYTITEELGIHARPAGILVKTAKTLDSEITISLGNKSTAATKLMSLMGMGIKFGDTITVTRNGGNEEASEKEMKAFFEANL